MENFLCCWTQILRNGTLMEIQKLRLHRNNISAHKINFVIEG